MTSSVAIWAPPLPLDPAWGEGARFSPRLGCRGSGSSLGFMNRHPVFQEVLLPLTMNFDFSLAEPDSTPNRFRRGVCVCLMEKYKAWCYTFLLFIIECGPRKGRWQNVFSAVLPNLRWYVVNIIFLLSHRRLILPCFRIIFLVNFV